MDVPDDLIKAKNIIGEDSYIFTRKHDINLISSIIVWLSGGMFILQYFENPFIKIIFYSIAFLVLIIIIERMEGFYKLLLTKNALFLILLILTAAVILLYRLDYIGYPSILGFTILWLIIIYYSQNVKVSLIQLTVFVLSPVLYSEMISFSGSFSFVMLVLISIFISERYLDNNKLDWKFFLVAFLFGVTLSAQPIVSFIYLIYLLYKFRNNVSKGSIFVLVMLASYALLFFLADRGYTLLTSSRTNYYQMIPVWIIIFLFLITLYVGWIVADLQEVLFASGIILFFIYLLSFILLVSEFGWNKNEIGLSLMIMAIPLLALSIKEYKVDRFLGKILE